MEKDEIPPATVLTDRSGPCPPGRIYRVLVVDDNADIRCLNAGALTHFGCEVDEAEDGAVAWRALNAHKYDLMITDNSMGGLTGIELLRQLHAARMMLPVIMATGLWPREELIAQPWLQPVVILLKPYSVTELLRAVKKVL